MSGAAIIGCGMALPTRELANHDLPAALDTNDEWIRTRTGIESRRIAAAGETTATLATEAGGKALADAGVDPQDLDLILVATCTPDYPMPGSSPLVQAALGARNAGAMDVNAGCNGFVAALILASSVVTAGTARRVLVCGSDTMSRITDWHDRTTAILFGDGAGAVVLDATNGPTRVGPFVQGADGTKATWLYTPTEARHSLDVEATPEIAHAIRMRGQDVYRHACDRMTESALALLGDQPASSIDLVVAHQANARIIATVADRLGLSPEQVICNVAQYGNTSAASIPIALTEAVASGRLENGMRVLVVAFGAGFEWGAGLVTWGSEN